MLRAALTALLLALPTLAIAPSGIAASASAQEETRAESFRRGFNSGVLHPEQFAEIDRKRYTAAFLERARGICLANDERVALDACATVGFITGRRAELAHRTRIAETGETYVPYLVGALDPPEGRAQAIRAYQLRVYPDQEALSDAQSRAAAFLTQTRPCIDAFDDAARGSVATTDCPS